MFWMKYYLLQKALVRVATSHSFDIIYQQNVCNGKLFILKGHSLKSYDFCTRIHAVNGKFLFNAFIAMVYFPEIDIHAHSFFY